MSDQVGNPKDWFSHNEAHFTAHMFYRSPGFGLTLVAETTNGAFLAAESASNPKGSDQGPSIPEDLGKEASGLLLEEIYRVLSISWLVQLLL